MEKSEFRPILRDIETSKEIYIDSVSLQFSDYNQYENNFADKSLK